MDAFSLAAYGEHETLATMLDREPRWATATDEAFGSTALMEACRHGHTATVALLLTRGANVNAADAMGNTALHWAAAGGHTAVTTLLIKSGADCGATTTRTRDTPLHLACRFGHGEVEKVLLAAGADGLARNTAGQPALGGWINSFAPRTGGGVAQCHAGDSTPTEGRSDGVDGSMGDEAGAVGDGGDERMPANGAGDAPISSPPAVAPPSTEPRHDGGGAAAPCAAHGIVGTVPPTVNAQALWFRSTPPSMLPMPTAAHGPARSGTSGATGEDAATVSHVADST